MEGPGRDLKGYAELVEQLCDLDARRIADMDAAGIDVQVLSLTSPGVEQLDATEAVALAREANDHLADAVRRHPNRFAGVAALPTAAPDTAADELARMVREHGFKGALRTSTTHSVASTGPRRSSTCCFRSALIGSCSQPTIPMHRWRRREPSWI